MPSTFINPFKKPFRKPFLKAFVILAAVVPAAPAMLPLAGAIGEKAGAQGAKANTAAANANAFFARRVIVLGPARMEGSEPPLVAPAEPNVSKYTSTRRKKPVRSRRRLFGMPASAQISVAPAKTGNKMGDKSGDAPVRNAMTGAPNAAKRKPADVVPNDQQSALAQSLLTDMVAERLHDRLGLTVVPEEDVNAALKTLRLTPSLIGDAAHRKNTRRLCGLLNCQALLVPRVTACDVRDGLTREVTLFARVRIDLNPVPGSETNSPALPAGRKSEMEGVAADKWPALIEVGGAAFAERVLFHSQYQKPQGDLIRDAAGQAANLLAHALRIDEMAPFVRSTDRLAVAPVVSPVRADKLVFTPQGRRVQSDAARGLSGDVSALFTPFLLPLTSERIVDTPEVGRALAAENVGAAALWKEDGLANTARVQTLARRLRADYVLMARVTDIELSEGASDPSTPENTSHASLSSGSAARQALANPLKTHTSPKSAQDLEPTNGAQEGRERAARVEAAGALVRASDGAVLWRDRATATMTTPSGDVSDARSRQTDPALVHDATRFALIELARRFRHYRAGFEK